MLRKLLWSALYGALAALATIVVATHSHADLAYAHGRRAAGDEEVTADQKVERAAKKLQQLANRLAGEGGLKAKLAQPLAEDAT